MRFQQKDESLIEIAKGKPNEYSIKQDYSIKLYYMEQVRCIVFSVDTGDFLVDKGFKNLL